MKDAKQAGTGFARLVGILSRLRGEKGCPWDREQDERSIANYFIEEVYEALEALTSGSAVSLSEELGDVLMEVVFLARIFEEKGEFSITDVLDGINDKMIRRHPHVFGSGKVRDSERIVKEWTRLKKTEKKRISVFDGLVENAPALHRAYQIVQRVSGLGFDGDDPVRALSKVLEETSELEKAVRGREKREAVAEIGDLLFAVASVARQLGVNPEVSLRQANDRFIRRFLKLETRLLEKGKSLTEAEPEEIDRIWEEVKDK